jgi:transposase
VAVPSAAHNTGERGALWNFIAALDADGIMDCTFHVLDSINSATFEDWVEFMLLPTILEKYPLAEVSVVMDNAAFYRRVQLGQMFNGAGVELIFLPAYCPEFNPIGTAFAWVKAHIRRTPTEAAIDLAAATHHAFDAVTGNLAAAWMRYSEFVFEE